jgi:hypothetical protein
VLLAFVKNIDAAENMARTLEDIAAAHRHGKLKVMLVVVDGTDEQLHKLAKDAAIQSVMLVRPDPERREKQLKAYKIDPAASNTVMLYQDYTVKKCWTGVKSTNLAELKTATDAYLPKR